MVDNKKYLFHSESHYQFNGLDIWRILIILSLFMSYYDYLWYGEKIVPLPYVSVVSTSLIAFYFKMIAISIKNRKIEFPKELYYILLFYFISQFSIIGIYLCGLKAEKLLQFLRTDIHFLFYIFFVFTLIQLFSKNEILKFLRFYYLCGGILTLFGILQFVHLNIFYISGFDQLIFGSSNIERGFNRVSSIFNEPSWFAFFLIDWMVIGFGFILVRGLRKEWIIIFLIVTAFFFTGSLGGYMIFIALLFLMVVRHKAIPKYIYLLFIILLLLIYASFTNFFNDMIVGRIKVLYTDPSFQMRLNSIQAAIKVWSKSPIIGVGIGNASFYTPEFYQGYWLYYYLKGEMMFHAAIDSVFFTILAENGLIGLIGLIGMYFGIIKDKNEIKSVDLKIKNITDTQENGNSSKRDLWIFKKIFKIVIFVNFIEFIVSGSFLTPRIWFNIGIYLSLKQALLKNVSSSAHHFTFKGYSFNHYPT